MIYKRGRKGIYWYRFMWRGELIRESTHQTNDKVARNQESAHRTRLSNGEVGIREKKRLPTVAQFLKKEFVPYVETKHASKPATVAYYKDGAKMVNGSDLAGLCLDEVNDQQAQRFTAQRAKLSASRINCGLRTLRRALNLAYQWGTLERLNADRPLLQVAEGKSKAARRILPMLPIVHSVLLQRREAQRNPEEGWVFPSNSHEGHLNGDTSKDQHALAIERSKVKRFEPYVLRHTALTRLAESGCDVFTLARIAGHSSITITQRYVHPQADAVERAFASWGQVGSEPHPENSQVGTNLGTAENSRIDRAPQIVGAKGGTRTPTVLPARS